jgi:hypothetical protein
MTERAQPQNNTPHRTPARFDRMLLSSLYTILTMLFLSEIPQMCPGFL